MAEPIYLDDIVQSTLDHPSDGEMAPLPGLREKGMKESSRGSLGEESEWTSKYLLGPCRMQSLVLSRTHGTTRRKELQTVASGSHHMWRDERHEWGTSHTRRNELDGAGLMAGTCGDKEVKDGW